MAKFVPVALRESAWRLQALAERVAASVLTRPLVEAVEVVVHKPQAPVGHPFTDVQVRVRRERETPVVIALGSNLGESLETALAIARHDDVVALVLEAHPQHEEDVGLVVDDEDRRHQATTCTAPSPSVT